MLSWSPASLKAQLRVRSSSPTDGHVSNPHPMRVAVPIAESLHPVTNPALDPEGNIYVTFSGSRGQKVPVAIFKIDTNYTSSPSSPT